MDRRTFVGTSGLLLAGTLLGGVPIVGGKSGKRKMEADGLGFPLMDLHVHRSSELSMEEILETSRNLNLKIGVMENVAPWGITCDEQLKAYLDAMKHYPAYVGLQPMSPGWSKGLSADLVAQVDYVAMDPQVVEKGNGYGETVRVWEYTAYIDDSETFMERNMAHCLDILIGDEPLDIFACPLFLPACIQREYETLWTKERMRQLIDAARVRGIAIEINDTAHVPHEEFVCMAKRAGLKFAFGSDTRSHTLGQLDYCKRIAKNCRLTEKDFFIPKKSK